MHRSNRWRLLILVVFTVALIVNLVARQVPSSTSAIARQSPTMTPPAISAAPQPSIQSPAAAPAFGHFPYTEAQARSLVITASYSSGSSQRFERLHQTAEEALLQLISAAREQSVWVIVISGFRSVHDQTQLFQTKVDKTGSQAAAAKTVAPPGYSEHHTGYAVDLGDGNHRSADVQINFDQTPAYRWLTAHAQEYGFELSFRPNNAQGVSYEPWHWRFRGTPEAKATFARAAVGQ